MPAHLTPTAADRTSLSPTEKSLLEETAALFAAGESRKTQEKLLRYAEQSQGRRSKLVWFMLFDIYRALAQHDIYEQIAAQFAETFDESPPAWIPDYESGGAHGHASLRNTLAVVGQPQEITPEKLRDFEQDSLETGASRIDLSRLTLPSEAELLRDSAVMTSLTRFSKAMKKIRENGGQIELMGETAAITHIKQILDSGQAIQTTHKPLWHFFFECLQWNQSADVFDEVAIQYITTFDESAPGFSGATEEETGHNPDDSESEGAYLWAAPRIDQSYFDSLLSICDAELSKFGRIDIDFGYLHVMLFDVAVDLAAYLKKLDMTPSRVIFSNLSEPIFFLFQIVGISSLATLIPRHR